MTDAPISGERLATRWFKTEFPILTIVDASILAVNARRRWSSKPVILEVYVERGVWMRMIEELAECRELKFKQPGHVEWHDVLFTPIVFTQESIERYGHSCMMIINDPVDGRTYGI